MRYSELSTRYASALYELVADQNEQDKVLSELRVFADLVKADAEIFEFLNSPLVRSEEKEEVFQKALKGSKATPEVQNFILLLAKKNRLGLFTEIVEAYQDQIDEAHGVTRGNVRSAVVLSPEQRKNIEDIVSNVTKKQVILNYNEDPDVIGGLIAQVGSYTFDDTLTSHLRRMKEELNRRTH